MVLNHPVMCESSPIGEIVKDTFRELSRRVVVQWESDGTAGLYILGKEKLTSSGKKPHSNAATNSSCTNLDTSRDTLCVTLLVKDILSFKLTIELRTERRISNGH